MVTKKTIYIKRNIQCPTKSNWNTKIKNVPKKSEVQVEPEYITIMYPGRNGIKNPIKKSQ